MNVAYSDGAPFPAGLPTALQDKDRLRNVYK